VAGEWIKVEKATPDKPEVLRMARLLELDRDLVLGKIVRFWSWADANSVDGVVDGVVSTDVDAVVDLPGFANALKVVGWLEFDDAAQKIALPKFGRHNGESAKKRALKTERQARWRDGRVDNGASTAPSTREEKNKEEELHSLTLVSSKTSEGVVSEKHRKTVEASNEGTGRTWTYYSVAYEKRYGVAPVRNAKVNSVLKQLVARLGADEAPAVAAFYVTHQGALYVRGKHPVELLLRDAEGLRTEWATGRTVTHTQATQSDRTAATANVFGNLIAEAESRERITNGTE
jgi:hypothetical protein